MRPRYKIKRRLLPSDMREASPLALPCRTNFCGLRSAIFIIVILLLFSLFLLIEILAAKFG